MTVHDPVVILNVRAPHECGPKVSRLTTDVPDSPTVARLQTWRCTGWVGSGSAWPEMHFNRGGRADIEKTVGDCHGQERTSVRQEVNKWN